MRFQLEGSFRVPSKTRTSGLTRAAVATLVFAVVSHGLKAEPANRYYLDQDHAEIRFSYDNLGLSRQSGRFLRFDAKLVFDEKEPGKSTVEATIDAASLTTDVAVLDKLLHGPHWFDVAAHPTITFRSTEAIRVSQRTGKVVGNLTIKGVTKPVTLDVVFNYSGDHPLGRLTDNYRDILSATFSARAVVNRSQFGMDQYVPMVPDAIDIVIETEFLKWREP